jgi:hypothetical protein
MSVVTFSFSTAPEQKFDTLNAQCQRLKSQLEQKNTWNGKIACVDEYGQTIIFFDVFTSSTIQTILFSEVIESAVQHYDELIVWTVSRTIFSIDLVTYKTEKRFQAEEGEDIWCVKSFPDKTLAIGFDKELIVFKNWVKQYSLPAPMAYDSILLQNGDICTVHDQRDRTIAYWKTTETHTTYKLGRCHTLLEFTPGIIVTFNGNNLLYLQSNKCKEVQANSSLYSQSLIKIKNGMFVVLSMESGDIYVYDSDELIYTIQEERDGCDKVMLVEPGVIGWQTTHFITYNVENRQVTGKYDCPEGEVVCVLR